MEITARTVLIMLAVGSLVMLAGCQAIEVDRDRPESGMVGDYDNELLKLTHLHEAVMENDTAYNIPLQTTAPYGELDIDTTTDFVKTTTETTAPRAIVIENTTGGTHEYQTKWVKGTVHRTGDNWTVDDPTYEDSQPRFLEGQIASWYGYDSQYYYTGGISPIEGHNITLYLVRGDFAIERGGFGLGMNDPASDPIHISGSPQGTTESTITNEAGSNLTITFETHIAEDAWEDEVIDYGTHVTNVTYDEREEQTNLVTIHLEQDVEYNLTVHEIELTEYNHEE